MRPWETSTGCRALFWGGFRILAMPQAWLWKLVVVPESAVPGVEFECHGSDMEEKKQGEEMFLLLNTPPPQRRWPRRPWVLIYCLVMANSLTYFWGFGKVLELPPCRIQLCISIFPLLFCTGHICCYICQPDEGGQLCVSAVGGDCWRVFVCVLSVLSDEVF